MKAWNNRTFMLRFHELLASLSTVDIGQRLLEILL